MSTSVHHNHVVPLKSYFAVAGTLFAMTIVTVAISYVDLGGFNAIVAVGIATFKALLVAFIFMHLLYDKKMYLYIFTIGIVFIGVFIALTMFDTLRRSDIYDIRGKSINNDAIIYQEKPDSSAIPAH
jgi:cytochrome c oxidase subunit IV